MKDHLEEASARRSLRRAFMAAIVIIGNHSMGLAADSPWSLKCVADAPRPAKPQECSLAIAVMSRTNKSVWIRMGVTYADQNSNPTLTIVTPQIHYLIDGLSLLADDKQLGQMPVKRCENDYCETSITMDGQLLSDLKAAKKVDVEYQTTPKNGVRLSVPFGSFQSSLLNLRTRIGLPPDDVVAYAGQDAGVKSSREARVELRYNPFNASSVSPGFGDLMSSCNGVSSVKIVSSNANGTLIDEDSLVSWINATNMCSVRGVYWVKSHDASLKDVFTRNLYDALVHKVTNVVVAGEDNVPSRPTEISVSPTRHDWSATLTPND